MGSFLRRHPNLSLLLLWMVATAFNITKAVHIDDTIYLDIAKWIDVSPLHPFSGQTRWVSTLEPNYHLSSSPLLFIYCLAAVLKVFGESEIALHALTAVFTGVCIWSFYYLAALPQIRGKMLLTAMLALGPAFLPSQNLMLDVPLLAFSTVFFWAIFASYTATARRKTLLLVVAGFAAGAGALTKYPGLILIVLLLVYLFNTRQFGHSWVALIPISLFAGWCAFNLYDYGGVHVLQIDTGSVQLYGQNGVPLLQLPSRLLDAIVCLGATSPFALLSLAYLRQGRRRRYALGGVGTFALFTFLLTFVFRGEDLLPVVLRVVFVSSGLLVLLALGHALYKERREARNSPTHVEASAVPPLFRSLLVLWLLLGTVFLLVLVPFMAVRHVLALVPPILLLSGLFVFPYVSRRLLVTTTVVTALMGAWIGAADWQIANNSRTEPPIIRAFLPSTAKVYFMGHWGWQWYAAQSNMEPYDLGTQLKPGDYIVAPHIIKRIPINVNYAAYLKSVREVTAPASPPLLVRTLSNEANFYGGGWTPLPWTLYCASGNLHHLLSQFYAYRTASGSNSLISTISLVEDVRHDISCLFNRFRMLISHRFRSSDRVKVSHYCKARLSGVN